MFVCRSTKFLFFNSLFISAGFLTGVCEVYDEKIIENIDAQPNGVLAGILCGAHRRKKRKSPPGTGQENYRKEICA